MTRRDDNGADLLFLLKNPVIIDACKGGGVVTAARSKTTG